MAVPTCANAWTRRESATQNLGDRTSLRHGKTSQSQASTKAQRRKSTHNHTRTPRFKQHTHLQAQTHESGAIHLFWKLLDGYNVHVRHTKGNDNMNKQQSSQNCLIDCPPYGHTS